MVHNHRRLVVLLSLFVASIAFAACKGETLTSPVGHGVFVLPTQTLAVGDSMTLWAGVVYNDGRPPVPFNQPTYSVSPAANADVNPLTGKLIARIAGPLGIHVSVTGATQLDSMITITP
jgi:hypothetical protein